MKPADAARLLGVSASALRTWSANEFKDFMSPTGKGGRKKYRDFTEVDLRILHLIDLMKKDRQSVEDIKLTLRAAQAEDWIRLPELPGDKQTALDRANARQLSPEEQEQRMALVTELNNTRFKLQETQERLDREYQRNEDLQKDVIRLEKRNSELELMVKLYEEGRLTVPRSTE